MKNVGASEADGCQKYFFKNYLLVRLGLRLLKTLAGGVGDRVSEYCAAVPSSRDTY